FGQDSKEATKKLILSFVQQLETDKDAVHRVRAARHLGVYGSDAKDALPAIRRALQNDPDPQVRDEAALALFRIAPSQDLLTEAEVLRVVQRDGRQSERTLASNLLRRLENEAERQVQAIRKKLLADGSDRARVDLAV